MAEPIYLMQVVTHQKSQLMRLFPMFQLMHRVDKKPNHLVENVTHFILQTKS